ncbi:aminotransferase class V-fold PLP-dependent enzyme [Brevibacillus sp. NRS-1366]|uniref:aminotransferase class V-fold PLP-dependent enzyme n=1 Tax=Brevibacillus sp. NRS-1366 TaxID=3233899 RepID=UPI003D1C4896
MKSLVDKSVFLGLDNCTWLYSGAETPTLRGSLEAVNDYLHARSKGPLGRENNTRVEALCKQNVAKLLHGKAEDIALISNTSEAIAIIAQSIPFEQGDNVVINTLEFPSGVLPWLGLQQKGVDVRVVGHRDWQVSPEDILARVDERTRFVMTSHVSYMSGSRLDYRTLYQSLKKTNALLLVDVTQSLGVVPVRIEDADFIVCSSYKWLLSIHGAGILAVNQSERVRDLVYRSPGWRSIQDQFSPNRFESYTLHEDARRYERGFPSYASLYSLAYSTGLLVDVGIENVEKHVLQLGDLLIERVKALGYEVMTPSDPSLRAGNISIVCSQGSSVAERLQQQNVYVWGGDGRVRASIHLFNDSADVNTFIELLPECVAKA